MPTPVTPTKPITPAAAIEAKIVTLPSVVIDVFNLLIVEHLDANRACVPVDDVLKAVASKCEMPVAAVQEKGWLRTQIFTNRIKAIYREVGWRVEQHPGEGGEVFVFEVPPSTSSFGEKD